MGMMHIGNATWQGRLRNLTIVFRASSIGHPCARKLWYPTMGHIPEPMSRETLRIFAVGTALEAVALSWLEEDGWSVEANAGSQQAEQEIVIPLGQGIEIRGHHDAIVVPPGEERRILLDVKTMNTRAWGYWVKEGTRKGHPGYVIQTSAYARGLGLSQCAIMGVNKDNSKYSIDTYDRDDALLEEAIERCLSVAGSPFVPEVDPEIPSWCCRYCGYGREGICDGIS